MLTGSFSSRAVPGGGELEEASDCNPQLSNVVANMRGAGHNGSG